jgi:hypothetical protein
LIFAEAIKGALRDEGERHAGFTERIKNPLSANSRLLTATISKPKPTFQAGKTPIPGKSAFD